MTTQSATRHFPPYSYTSRTMAYLAATVERHSYRNSATLHKHGPVILLALAAHHDLDETPQRRTPLPGYTASELAPFVGLGVSTVAEVLRGLTTAGLVDRYRGEVPGFRYRLDRTSFGE